MVTLVKMRHPDPGKSTKKAVGMISGLKGKNYAEQCKERKLDTLRHDKQDLHKIMTGSGALNPEDLSKKPETITPPNPQDKARS